jgi:hypothetical protein
MIAIAPRTLIILLSLYELYAGTCGWLWAGIAMANAICIEIVEHYWVSASSQKHYFNTQQHL